MNGLQSSADGGLLDEAAVDAGAAVGHHFPAVVEDLAPPDSPVLLHPVSLDLIAARLLLVGEFINFGIFAETEGGVHGAAFLGGSQQQRILLAQLLIRFFGEVAIGFFLLRIANSDTSSSVMRKGSCCSSRGSMGEDSSFYFWN